MRVVVYLGASEGVSPVFRTEAEALGRMLGECGHGLVYGGSRVGLMGWLADAALKAGAEVTGVEPKFFVDSAIQHTGIQRLIVTETMAQRKQQMIALGEAFIAFPGGVGTLEEISEVMTLKMLGKLYTVEETTGHLVHEFTGSPGKEILPEERPVMLYNLRGYYDPLKLQLRQMVREGLLSGDVWRKIGFPETLEEIRGILDGKPLLS